MNTKSLYYYIIQESRGTLGGKYKYDDLVDKIIELFLKKNYHVNTTVLKLAGEELLTDDDKKELSKYYPEWLGDIRIIEVMADHLCDQFVLKECEICYRYIFGKMPKGRFAKDKVLKMLLDFQNKLYIFITKKIYGRVWNE